jgi:hypothetical protein
VSRGSDDEPLSGIPFVHDGPRGETMSVLSLVLAIMAVVAMATGMILMTSSEFGAAGALFVSASIVIYLRTRVA